MRLILASASPRRRELLLQAGFAFEVRVAGIDETRHRGEEPMAYVQRLAVEKARAVAALPMPGSVPREPGYPREAALAREHEVLVLGADTTVVLEGEVMNKPLDRRDAERMLRALAGRTHQVHTGVAVVGAGRVRTHVETTDVVFREIGSDEMEVYLASGDPLDKAGAYGIQGYAARWIPRIVGDYFNVVGLPIAAVVRLLEEQV